MEGSTRWFPFRCSSTECDRAFNWSADQRSSFANSIGASFQLYFNLILSFTMSTFVVGIVFDLLRGELTNIIFRFQVMSFRYFGD